MKYIKYISLTGFIRMLKTLQSKLHNCEGVRRCCSCLKENDYSAHLRLALRPHSHTLYSAQLRILG